MSAGFVATRGFFESTTAGTTSTITLAAGASVGVGSVLVLRVVADNAVIGGGAPYLDITDPKGNVWTLAASAVRDPAGANEGSAAYVLTAPVTVAYANGDVITITYRVSEGGATQSVTAKVGDLEEWTGISTADPVAAFGTSSGPGSPDPFVSLSPTARGQLMIAMMGIEGPSTDGFTPDLDDNEGLWLDRTTRSSASSGGAAAQTMRCALKVPWSTDLQAWDPAIGVARDWAGLIVAFENAITPLPTPPHADAVTWDNCTRADTTTGLGIGTSRVTWTGQGSELRILTNSIREAAGGSAGRVYALQDGFIDNVEVRINLTTSSTANTTDIGLVLLSDPTVPASTGHRLYVRMRKIVGTNSIALINQNPVTPGADTTLAQDTTAGLLDGTTYTLSATATEAGLVTVFLNDVAIPEITDIDVSALDLPNHATGITFHKGNDGGSRINSFETRHLGRTPIAAQIIAHRASIAALGDEHEEKISTLAELPPDINGIEIDARLSFDDVPVLMHDETIDRTTPGSGTTLSLTEVALRQYGIPTLEGFLEACEDYSFDTIYIQCMAADADLHFITEVVDASPLKERCILMPATLSALDNLRAVYDGRIGSFGVDTTTSAATIADLTTYSGEVGYIVPGDAPYLANRSEVADLIAAGFDAGASTVNSSEAILAAIDDGCKYILTDRSDQFRWASVGVPIEGELGATLPGFVAAAAGTATNEAALLTPTMPAFSAAFAGETASVTAVLGPTMPAFVADFEGTGPTSLDSVLAVGLPKITAAMAANIPTGAVMTATLPAFSSAWEGAGTPPPPTTVDVRHRRAPLSEAAFPVRWPPISGP